jgi:YD repeat-containing protein
MHFLLIHQPDPALNALFKPITDRGAGTAVTLIGGHPVRIAQMVHESQPKADLFDYLVIAGTIIATCEHALQAPDRAAEITIFFIFHQTSAPAVRAIMNALNLLAPDVLDQLAVKHKKDLSVPTVVILSCESGTDKVAPTPVPADLQRWVDQARNMREACNRAFSINGVTVGAIFEPRVVTFSTGDAVTGGVTLNPWGPEFKKLHGHFNPDGTWSYDLDANGQPIKTEDPSAGTVYVDSAHGGSTTSAATAGQALPSMVPFPQNPPP